MSLSFARNKNLLFNLILAGLMSLVVIFFLFGLGRHALIDYDEATYGQVVAECLEKKDCLSFTYLGNNWFEKPPLYFWLAAGSIKLFGVNEFAQRLPSALLGVLAVLLVGLITWELTRNRWAALAAAAILLLNGEFAFAARQFRMDIPVTASLLFAVYSFIRGWRDSRWYLGVGLAIGAGVMFKSVIGFLSLPVILIFSLVFRRWDFLKSGYFWLATLVSAALILPWHIYESARFGREFWDSYLGLHIFERLRRPIIGQGITTFHYLKYLFYLVEPWITAALVCLGFLIFKFGRRLKDYDRPTLAAGGAAIFIFVIFALARTKLFYYLEPLQPFLAIFIATTGLLIYDSRKNQAGKKNLSIFFCALLIIGLINTNWQVFETRGGFTDEFPVADEEKTVGQYLAKQAPEQNIYVYGWSYLETLRYYSHGRKVIPIDKINYATAPFFLVMPAELAKLYQSDKEFRQRAAVILRQAGVSLYEVK